MFCNHCGRELNSNSRFCKYCGQQLTSATNEKKNTAFYLILFTSPIIMFISNLIILFDSVTQYPVLFSKMIFSAIPIVSIVFIAITLILVKYKKIITTCCESYDIITWSVLPLATSIYSCYESLSLMHCEYGSITLVSAYSIYSHLNSILTMPLVWYYVCLILFLLIRSNHAKLGKKGVFLIAVVLIVWSIVLVLFRYSLLRLYGIEPAMIELSSSFFACSAFFMWMRHLILLWFALQLGRKKIGFICGIICSVGTYFVAGVATALFMDKMLVTCIGLSESIGYVIFGLVVLVATLINKSAD